MVQYGLIDKNERSGVPLEKIQVRGTIIGFTAEITAVMEYNNSGDSPIEAIYVFPLDEEAAVCGFQATIDGRTIVAEVQEKQEARDTYDDAISSGHSAYLLEESDESSDVFQINVGNLPPKKSASVEITFVTELAVEKEGQVVFVLPTVLNPRYTPRDSQHSVSATMPTIASVSAKYSFDFEIDVESASSIKEITSPCNRLTVDIDPEDDKRAKVRLDEEYKFDADVQVHVLNCNPFEPYALVENGVTKTKDGKDLNDFMSKPVIMLNFFPEFDGTVSLERGEFIFVVDRSGSMGGSRMNSAKETLLLFLKSLPDGCYFNVVGFGSSFEKLFTESKLYSDSTLDEACSHAKSMNADLGGTEILRPLKDVFSQPLIGGYARQVFLLTDGEVGNTEAVIDLVSQNNSKARCFSFGIGSGASTALIKGVARAGRGKADFVISAEKMHSKVIKMLKNALQPALLDCAVSWDLPKDYSAESVPNPLPPIFSGNSLFLYGLLTSTSEKETKTDEGQLNGMITLSATTTKSEGVQIIQHKISFQESSSKSEGSRLILHRLAAKALIQSKQQEGYGNDDKKKDIIRMSQSANVISKLTSFVVVDKNSHEVVSRPMRIFEKPLMDCALYMGGAHFAKASSKVPAMALKSKSKGAGFNLFSKVKSRRSKKKKCLMGSAPSGKLTTTECSFSLEDDGETDEDSFFGAPDAQSFSKSASWSVKADNPLSLVSLQKACGSWQLTAQLAGVCGVALDKLKKACPSELPADNKESVWATALALSYLEGKYKSKKDEWEMVAEKGSKWLKKNLKKNTLSYEEIIEMASKVLGI